MAEAGAERSDLPALQDSPATAFPGYLRAPAGAVLIPVAADTHEAVLLLVLLPAPAAALIPAALLPEAAVRAAVPTPVVHLPVRAAVVPPATVVVAAAAADTAAEAARAEATAVAAVTVPVAVEAAAADSFIYKTEWQ